MTVHEYGKENKEAILLIHPSVVTWDYFRHVIPRLEKEYHLILPALPGYDPDTKDDFTSIEDITKDLEAWLIGHGLKEIAVLYGCSMGGSVAARMLANNRLHIRGAIMDGGITPYRLPWLLTRLLALKDFLMIYLGKLGGVRILEKAFATDEYSKEDLKYAEAVLKRMSAKTIWRTFDSCNNYSMPKEAETSCRRLEYWFAERERQARKRDMAYIRKIFPHTRFRRIRGIGHAGLAALQPEKLAYGILRMARAA